jgi:hypothetical protein
MALVVGGPGDQLIIDARHREAVAGTGAAAHSAAARRGICTGAAAAAAVARLCRCGCSGSGRGGRRSRSCRRATCRRRRTGAAIRQWCEAPDE